jgi:hypothetical protein
MTSDYENGTLTLNDEKGKTLQIAVVETEETVHVSEVGVEGKVDAPTEEK